MMKLFYLIPLIVLLCLVTVQVNAQSCNCTDYIYLNDHINSEVHKFAIDPNDGTNLTEVGNPWLASGIGSPHGIASDNNGFLYISSTSTGEIAKLTCDGDIVDADYIPSGGAYFNSFSIGNTLYATSTSGTIVAYDLCSGTELGGLCLNDGGDVWGLWLGADGCMYASRRWQFEAHAIYKICDWSNQDFIDGTCYDAFIDDATIRANATGDDFVVGVTADESGNIYFVTAGDGFGNCLQKYDSNGVFVAEICDTPADGGIYSTGGLLYHNGLLYLSGQDRCVVVVDPVTLEVLPGGVPQAGDAKAIGILTECCPNPSELVIDTLLCNISYPAEITLQDILNCEGVVCEGSWSADAGNTGMNFDECENSVSINGDQACGTFTLFSDGTNALSQCGQFTITFNIETASNAPATVTGDQNLCPGDTPTDLVATSSTAGVTYQWQMSTTSCTDGFADIAGATEATYTPQEMGQTVYYQVITSVTGGCASGMCDEMSNCVTVTEENCSFPSLRLGKTVDATTVALGQPVTFTLTVYNDGTEELTNVEVTDALPTGLTYTGDNSGGSYDSGTGIWAIPSIAIGDSAVIEIMATMDTEGVVVNEAEITAADQLGDDPDPIDNTDRACVSVPVEVCDNEAISVLIEAGAGFTNYQWYKDGVLIAGESGATYTATEIGSYTYTVDGAGPTGDCEGELCCPIIIEQVSCCPPIQCLPITVTKVE